MLLTVEAEQTRYGAEFRGDVVMGCRFQPALSKSGEYLKVTWHWITASSSREVYWVDGGVERLASQHPDYRGRVALLREGLEEGWARIKVNAASEIFRRGLLPVIGPQSDVVNLFPLLGITELYHSTL